MYYKTRLPSIDDNPPVLVGVIVSFDTSHGTGSVREITSGNVFKFREDDAVTFSLFPDNRVLFSLNKAGNAIQVRKIFKH